MSGDDIRWKPFSLTFVEYPEGDAFGKLLAIVSLFPVGMLVGCFALMLFRRDLHTYICLIVSYVSRVYLLYHSWAQVIVGSVLGAVLGVGWFFIVHVHLTPLFPQIASWSICELLMIRDTSLIPNILWFEYTHARNENRARNRKLVSMKSQ
ncbi:dolichyldiphosphatase 1 [Hyalella azteca]|uniref:Dolichyldiphosphatase 1 n=1 Tax=Hyalella azteca TaxID=294128 RepID=A0A8B7N0V3_HYAAZ|nr:dolichyldiphosphatase 1 [Hyalella azteca]